MFISPFSQLPRIAFPPLHPPVRPPPPLPPASSEMIQCRDFPEPPFQSGDFARGCDRLSRARHFRVFRVSGGPEESLDLLIGEPVDEHRPAHRRLAAAGRDLLA